MAEKKIVKVEFQEKGLDELAQGLDKVEGKLSEVDRAGDKASKSVDDVASNGGAIAILDQLTGGLATRLRDAYEASKLLNFSLKGMRAALIATGIGALVVSLGIVVAYWDEIVDFISGANRKLERQLEIIDTKTKRLNFELQILEKQKELRDLEGKSTDEVNKKIIQKLKLLIEQEKQEQRILGIQLERAQAKALEVTFAERVVGFFKGGVAGVVTGDQSADLTKLNEISEKLKESKLQAYDLEISLAKIQAGDPRENPTDSAEGGGARETQSKADTSPKGVVTGLTLDNLKSVIDWEQNLIQKAREEDLKAQNANTRAKRELYELEQDARLATLAAAADGVMAFASIVGQQTAAGKALAIAGATMNTFLGITEVWSTKSTLPEPFATISRIANTAVVAASGFSAVRSINKVRIPNVNISRPQGLPSGNTGGGAVSAPAVRTPDFNIVGRSDVNQLAQVINERERQPVRAYVVSKDIETQSELDRRIKEKSTIG